MSLSPMLLYFRWNMWPPPQPFTFAAAVLASYVILIALHSGSTVYFHVILGLPYHILPWVFQSNTCLVMLFGSFLQICPSHVHFLYSDFLTYQFLFCSPTQFFICDTFWPSNIEDLSKSAVYENLELDSKVIISLQVSAPYSKTVMLNI